jgi:hypothetical protein
MLNSIQVDTQFKSVRCNKLPVLAAYFDEFYLVHCEAVSNFEVVKLRDSNVIAD